MAQEFVAANGAPVGEVRGLSQVERVVDTFVAPSKTFTDILRSASWWLPLLLMVLSTTLVANTVGRKVGFDRVFQNQVQESQKTQDRIANSSPEQKAMILKMGPMQMAGTLYGIPIFLTIGFLIYALLLWASFNFGLGAQTTYPQVLAVTWYAALPYLVVSLITFLTVQFRHDPDAFDLKNPVGTNLGYYLTDASPMVKAALSSIDVIKLWSVVLQVIGMAIISKKTIVQSAVVVGIFWILGVLMGTAGAAFS